MTAAAATPDRDAGELRRARFHETNAVLGMTIFVASWAMLFAGLFFAYGVTRLRTPAWPPSGPSRLARALSRSSDPAPCSRSRAGSRVRRSRM